MEITVPGTGRRAVDSEGCVANRSPVRKSCPMSSRSVSAEDILRGALVGLIGGAVASWVMNQYTSAQQQQEQEPPPSAEQEAQARRWRNEQEQAQRQASASRSRQRSQEAGGGESEEQGEDATVKTAQAISRNLFGHELTPSERQVAGPAVHYAYGALVGGLYGALAESWSTLTTGFGMLYGMALWLLGDEAAVPALRLGPPPTRVPPRKHADYLAAHLVYGIALDLTRRALRHIV